MKLNQEKGTKYLVTCKMVNRVKQPPFDKYGVSSMVFIKYKINEEESYKDIFSSIKDILNNISVYYTPTDFKASYEENDNDTLLFYSIKDIIFDGEEYYDNSGMKCSHTIDEIGGSFTVLYEDKEKDMVIYYPFLLGKEVIEVFKDNIEQEEE